LKQSEITRKRKEGNYVKKVTIGAVLGLFFSSMVLMAGDAEKAGEGMSLGEPFWRSKAMENEPVLFIQEEGKPVASGKLLFIPRAKFKITHPDRVM
jgi:hypothetical protein